ncbi:MAG: hypothetical protein WDZ36_02175 [Balneolaceae bacterium]
MNKKGKIFPLRFKIMTVASSSSVIFQQSDGVLLDIRKKLFPIHLVFFLSFLLFSASCDQVFEPWQENDQYEFSIFGYLDSTQDTQWVRVMPVREDLFLEHDPLEATVTLEHLQSGETVIMNDSLVSFFHDRYAWNFWTTMEIEPEQTYRLRVERPDGTYSQGRVTLPPAFPAPLVIIEYTRTNSPVPSAATVFLEGVSRLADVRTVLGPIRVSHLKDTTGIAAGYFRVAIDLSEDLRMLSLMNPGVSPAQLISSDSKIYITSAGPDYHFFGSLSEKVIALPDGVSNIEKGLGYLAGIVSKTVPLQSCREKGGYIPCDPEPPPW